MSTENGTGLSLYFVDTDGPVFGTEQDALDLLGQTYGKEIDVIVVPANRFSPDFYDLSSRLAGHFFSENAELPDASRDPRRHLCPHGGKRSAS